jgi:hypothetical protein
MYINVPMEMTWNLPEGRFKGRLSDIRPHSRVVNEQNILQARFIFEVDVPTIKNRQPMAAQNYDLVLGPNSQLRLLLEGWKGKDWVTKNAGQQIDLKQLIDEKVEVELYHKRSPGHKNPLVLVQAVHPLSNN